MFYIPKIGDCLEILAYEEVKDFEAINFSEYFKSTREEQNLRKVSKSLYLFPATPDEVEKYVEIIQSNSSDNCVRRYNADTLNIFDPELQLINTNPMIKNKLKELLSKFKKFKVQAKLVLDYKKGNYRKIFHSSAKLIASDSDIVEAFKFMNQSIMAKIKNYACKDWIALM